MKSLEMKLLGTRREGIKVPVAVQAVEQKEETSYAEGFAKATDACEKRYMQMTEPMKTKKRISLQTTLIVISVLVLVMVAAYLAPIRMRYDKALALIDEGDYAGARKLLEEIKDHYEEAESWWYYCMAQWAKENGMPSLAVMYMKKTTFNYLTDEQSERYNTTMDELVEAAEKAEEERIKRAAIDEERRIREGVPYDGMPESRIRDTSLGAPSSKVRHNTVTLPGSRTITNIYDWYNNKGYLIFSARCYGGTVHEIWDYQCNPRRPFTSYGETYSTSKEEDIYHASDYTNEEDFYDDHYDDFFDYYEAEEYYWEHHQ